MPLSFRRSFHKKPSAQLARNRRRLSASNRRSPPLRPAEQLRAPRYPLGVLIGVGVLLVTAAVVIANRQLLGTPEQQTPTWTATLDPATPRYETAVAARLATLAAATDTRSPPPLVTAAPPSAIPTETAAATSTASATSPPPNSWAATIPEAACIPPDLPRSGLVVGIVDGNTIRVRLDGDQRVYSVRYIGVRAPQAGQYYAAISEAANLALVYLKNAILVRDLTDADPQGTLLRYVMAEGKFVNYELIAGGYAQAIASDPDTACLATFRAAQQNAERGKAGMWSGPAYLIPRLPTP